MFFFIIIITTIFLQVWMENNEAKETYYSSYTKRILFRMWIDPEPDKNNLNIWPFISSSKRTLLGTHLLNIHECSPLCVIHHKIAIYFIEDKGQRCGLSSMGQWSDIKSRNVVPCVEMASFLFPDRPVVISGRYSLVLMRSYILPIEIEYLFSIILPETFNGFTPKLLLTMLIFVVLALFGCKM